MKKITFAFLAISLLVACKKDSTDMPQELKTPFTIKVNQTASLAEAGLKITLVEISEDSRCPIGVECIVAGRLVADFKVENDGEELFRRLSDYPMDDPTLSTEFEAFGHIVKLIEALPAPTGELAQKDYILKIEVE